MYGMRNSNCVAIAPTATIANIVGVTASIEPTYQNIYVKSNLSGDFTVSNRYLVDDLKALGIWDDVMLEDIKYFDGVLEQITRIPESVRAKYPTAFEVEPKWLIDCAARRQKWMDQAQSLNLYIAEPSGKKLDEMYKLAWRSGLKTTYYLRSMGASSTEKYTARTGALNAVSAGGSNGSSAPQACAIDDPDCEACQ
jgi:ribonucleoside-diphosphate reductase alpha chain